MTDNESKTTTKENSARFCVYESKPAKYVASVTMSREDFDRFREEWRSWSKKYGTSFSAYVRLALAAFGKNGASK